MGRTCAAVGALVVSACAHLPPAEPSRARTPDLVGAPANRVETPLADPRYAPYRRSELYPGVATLPVTAAAERIRTLRPSGTSVRADAETRIRLARAHLARSLALREAGEPGLAGTDETEALALVVAVADDGGVDLEARLDALSLVVHVAVAKRDDPRRIWGIALLHQLAPHDPRTLEALTTVADLAISAGRHEDAIAALTAVIEAPPSQHRAYALYRLASIQLTKADDDGAMYERAMANLVRACTMAQYYDQSPPNEARVIVEAAAADLAIAYVAVGNPQRAWEFYRVFLDREAALTALAELGRKYHAQGRAVAGDTIRLRLDDLTRHAQ